MSEFNFDGLGIEELLQVQKRLSPLRSDWKAIETAKKRKHSLLKELTNKVEALDDSFYVIDES
jgi:hypothetical protein